MAQSQTVAAPILNAATIVTNDQTPTLSLLAPNGTSVQISRNDQIIGSAESQSPDLTSITITEPLPIGIYQLQAFAVYEDGESSHSESLFIPPLVIIESLPLDIGGIVKVLKTAPTINSLDVKLLLSYIRTIAPEREIPEPDPDPEIIVRIDNITRNTQTDTVSSATYYTLPTMVTAHTNLGNTREVPVTWTRDGLTVTEASRAQAGTFTFTGTTPEFEQSFSFILTVTDVNMYRIILTWNQDPSDLDSHLFGHYTDGEGDPFHIYYGNKLHQSNNVTVAELERDITDGYGPETTSIYFDGNTRTYKFGVYHYSGIGTLATSGATVHLYRGDTLLESYYVTTATTAQGTTTETARYWNIFELMNGNLTSINQLESELYYPDY
jgi:hypothetical protein